MSFFQNTNVETCNADSFRDSHNGNFAYEDNTFNMKQPLHHDNFDRDGYVAINQSYTFQRRNTIAFWILVVVLFVLAVGNLTLTFIILGVLRLGQGMESMELMSEESLIKFYGMTDLDEIYKRDGLLESFKDYPLDLTTHGGTVHVGIIDGERVMSSDVDVSINKTSVKNIDVFEILDPVSGEPIFSTDFPNFGLPKGVMKLDIKIAMTKRISSPVDENLSIVSDSVVKLVGSEGTHVSGKEILWSADQDIFLKSVNGSIVLSGNEGITVDVRSLPMVFNSLDHGRMSTQFKICVCMPKGKLFRVPVIPSLTNSCINIVDNPCL